MDAILDLERRETPRAEEAFGERAVRGRVCNRAGCGKRLLKADGSPDFRRQFCSRECLNADSREQKEAARAAFRGAKCPLCGRRPPAPPKGAEDALPDAGVCKDTGQGGTVRYQGVVGVLRMG